MYRFRAGMLLFVRAMFSAQGAGHYKWAAGRDDTEIIISDRHPYNVDAPGKRPAIITMQGPGRWAGLSLNQTQGYNFTLDRTTKQDLVSTSLTFACLSREGVEAGRLAWFLFSMLPLFHTTLCRSIHGLHGLQLGQMTIGNEESAESLTQGSSAPEWKMVRVAVPAALQHRGSIEPEVKTYLREVELTLQGLDVDVEVEVS